MTEPATDYAALFGRNLRAARLHAGLKMDEVSERSWSQSYSTISAIEHGATSM